MSGAVVFRESAGLLVAAGEFVAAASTAGDTYSLLACYNRDARVYHGIT